MKILFKQFFNSFKKNHFNIFSLSVLMTALGFVVTCATNLSYSFISSIHQLDNQGVSSEVVSNVPDKFGKLDFSYSLEPVPQDVPVNIITSSLQLNKDPASGEYKRDNNTLFPYSESDFIDKGKKFKSASLITFGNGWTYNRNATSDADMFSLASEAPHPIYNLSASEIRLPTLPVTPFNKMAFSISFSDLNNKLLFNPQTMLFNKYGIPYTVFDKGNLTQEINLFFANINYNAKVFKSHPNWTDANGIGIMQEVWNRHGSDGDSIDRWNYVQTLTPETFDYWPNTLNFSFYQLSKYIQVEENVPSYEFSINLSPNSSTSTVIRTYLQSNPQSIKQIFSDVFYAKDFSRSDINYDGFVNGKKVSDPISLIEKDGEFKIRLSIPNRLFVDLTNPDDEAAQIKKNKDAYLKNFANFLSEKFTNSIYEQYQQDLKSHLASQGVMMNAEKEYFYHEPKQDVDVLFVEKNAVPINEIVISKGNNLSKVDVIQNTKEMLNSKVKGKPSRQAFYAMNQVIDMIPQSNIDALKAEDKDIPKLPSSTKGYVPDPAFASSSYVRFKLFTHCIKQICENLSTLPNDVVPQSIIDSPEMKTMVLMMAQTYDKIFEFNTSGIQLNFNARDWIVPLTKPATINWTINVFSTSMTVISEAYAVENDKKHLPKHMKKKEKDMWLSKIDSLNQDTTIANKDEAFSNWLDTIKDSDAMALSPEMISELFTNNASFFQIWKQKLPFDYKIKYQDLSFIIIGYGLSPDYAYPVISPTSPVPNPKNQLIAYLCQSAFNGLGANQSDIFSYYSYYSNTKTPKEIISLVKKFNAQRYGQQLIKISETKDATFMQTVWLRSFFPQEVVVLIVVFAICSAVFLILLSLFTISFLMKSLIKNLLEPIAVCLANGTSFKKVLWAILLNIGILTTITTMIGFTAAFLLQAPLLSLLSSIWFIPTQTVWYHPLIFIPLVGFSFGVLATILTISLKKQLKKPVPEILANKQTIKTNKLTNFMRTNRIKGQLLPKMSYGFSTINFGRLSLLAVLGALSVGTISSSIVIKSKFNESYYLTHQARNYDYEYQLQNINESTGLMKPQEFTRLGFEEPSVGISSLYADGDLIYKDEQLVAKMIPYHGDKSQITTNTKNPGTLSNLVLPSYKIYDELKNRRTTTLYNSAASLFLLKVRVNIGVTEINIWDFVAPYFPSWIISQLDEQLDHFKDAVMNYYGEWYFDFLDFDKSKSNIMIETLDDNNHNNLDLKIDNVSKENAGYYFAQIQDGKKTYRTKPFYVWPDSQEWYHASDATIAKRFEVTSGTNISLDASALTFNECDSITFEPTKKNEELTSVDPSKIEWRFVPAYNNNRELAGSKISEPKMTETQINDAFMDFITVVFSDAKLTAEDSKLTFGIIPYKPIDKTTQQGDEKVTKVLTRVYRHKAPIDPLEIYGIQPNSIAFPLIDSSGNDISSRLYSSSKSNEVNVIVNNGVALRYNLEIGDTLRVHVDNNSLQDSFNLMNQFIYSKFSPINNEYKLRVVGISSDSFGEKVYVDQKQANIMTGLDQMQYYNHIKPDKSNASTVSTITRVKPDVDDYNSLSFPFNTIVSKADEMLITKKNIPFYSYANSWGTDMALYDIQELPSANTLDSIVTFNQSILIQQAIRIKNEFDPSFDATNDPGLRDRVLQYYINNFSGNKIKQALESNNDVMLLKTATYQILPTKVTEDIFNIISTLSTTLIVASISILIPLLLLVCISTSLSIMGELGKQINLLKVLGYSNRNIVIMFLISFIPVFFVSSVLGLGMVFAINYGLQFLLFTLSSVFIYPYVYPLPYIIGIITLAAIFSIALISSWAKMNHSKLDTAIKF